SSDVCSSDLSILISALAYASQAEPLGLESKIPLGDVKGRIDHLAVDAARQRLYIAELGNGSVGVVDVKARKLLRTLHGFREPQGIGYEPSTDTVYVASAGDASVRLLQGGRIFVNGPDANEIAVLDLTTAKQTSAWATKNLRANFPLAIDAERQQVVAMFRHPAKLAAFNLSGGGMTHAVEACGDSDDLFVDAQRRLIYIS